MGHSKSTSLRRGGKGILKRDRGGNSAETVMSFKNFSVSIFYETEFSLLCISFPVDTIRKLNVQDIF